MSKITDEHANKIIEVLDNYPLTEQISCLTSLIFSLVLAHCEHNMDMADVVVRQVFSHMPHHWELTKGVMQLHSLDASCTTRH
jgi:hypothetical protein